MDVEVTHEIGAPEELLAVYETHWWFEGRDIEDIQRSIEHSDAFIGLRDTEADQLVASARVITDFVYTAKVLDVIVDGEYRGQGLGTRLMAAVVDHPDLQDVDELTVNCRAGLVPFYEACGFEVHEMINRSDRPGDSEDYYVMVQS